jgi:D-alanyl-D-alanine carboxypeptidase (penicillin-binding protein 5/6)
MKLIYLLMFSFVLISASSIALTHTEQDVYLKKFPKGDIEYRQNTSNVIVPILAEDVSYPTLSAQAALAYDLDTETVLYEKNPDTPFLPASTTKIITALVAIESYPVDTILTVHDVNVEGQKMHLVVGEKISVRNLLYGLLVFSANDAAEVLAQNYPQGREAFIEAMNVKVKKLGLKNTFFDNPTGLDGNDHVTTAKDLVLASSVAMENPLFREIVRTKQVTVKSENEEIAHELVNINELIGEVEGVLGVKTGWTEVARENLVTYIEREDEESVKSDIKRRVMIVLLRSQDRFGETKELIEWIFGNYNWEEVEVAI